MKRFMLFIYPCYYPAGGMGDFRGDFDTIEKAVEYSDQWCDPEVDSIYCKTPERVHEECFMHIYDIKKHKEVLWKDRSEGWRGE